MFDIPSIFLTESQHETEQKVCPHCHCVEESMFLVDFAYGSFQPVHHLREFQRICEQSPQAWTKEMMNFLLAVKEVKAQADDRLSAEQLVHFEKEFIWTSEAKYRSRNHLLDRLGNHRDSI